jgi:hypothetical protein
MVGITQRTAGRYSRRYLVVAIDPANFEKPETVDLEGVSTVVRSTAPGDGRVKRLTPGYPALAVTIINLPEPVITYANCFPTRPLISSAVIHRGHRGIENRLHWVRDVNFTEDASRIHTGNVPQVMAAFRNLAVGLRSAIYATSHTTALMAC